MRNLSRLQLKFRGESENGPKCLPLLDSILKSSLKWSMVGKCGGWCIEGFNDFREGVWSVLLEAPTKTTMQTIRSRYRDLETLKLLLVYLMLSTDTILAL
jgi:hypothetical protein